jgi:hypothetical protein
MERAGEGSHLESNKREGLFKYKESMAIKGISSDFTNIILPV